MSTMKKEELVINIIVIVMIVLGNKISFGTVNSKEIVVHIVVIIIMSMEKSNMMISKNVIVPRKDYYYVQIFKKDKRNLNSEIYNEIFFILYEKNKSATNQYGNRMGSNE